MTNDNMLLTVHLAELKFVHDQMHTRMAIVSRLVNVSAAFFSILVTTYILKFGDIVASKYEIFIGISLIISFFGLALLIAREDFLMINHDKYLFTKLRPAILETSGETNKDTLTFLQGMSDDKIGVLAAIPSAARYMFPLLGLTAVALRGFFINPHGYLLGFSAIAVIVGIALILVGINNKKEKVDQNA